MRAVMHLTLAADRRAELTPTLAEKGFSRANAPNCRICQQEQAYTALVNSCSRRRGTS